MKKTITCKRCGAPGMNWLHLPREDESGFDLVLCKGFSRHVCPGDEEHWLGGGVAVVHAGQPRHATGNTPNSRDVVKQVMISIIEKALGECDTLYAFICFLKQQDVDVELQVKNPALNAQKAKQENFSPITGIRFVWNGHTFAGSDLGKSYAWAPLSGVLACDGKAMVTFWPWAIAQSRYRENAVVRKAGKPHIHHHTLPRSADAPTLREGAYYSVGDGRVMGVGLTAAEAFSHYEYCKKQVSS